MLSHDDLLTPLRRAFPGRAGQAGVTLVARYFDEALALPSEPALVFIPDTHLLTDADTRVYPNYHFTPQFQGAALTRLLRELAELKSERPDELVLFQLGDFFDQWRATEGRTPKEQVDDIAGDHAEMIDLFRSSPPAGVDGLALAGNHDYACFSLQEWQSRRFVILPNPRPGGGEVLVTHGDLFDWAEQLVPEDLKTLGVRFAKAVKGDIGELRAIDQSIISGVNRTLPRGDAPIGENVTTFSDGGPLDALMDDVAIGLNLFDQAPEGSKPTRYFRQARAIAEELDQHGFRIRTVVIGHSHSPRMVYGLRTNGLPLLLMDCGAWFGCCRVGDGPVQYSQQLGVVVGGDLRIYQLYG